MRIKTRSTRIRRALSRVLAAIPLKDMRAITSVVSVVKAEKAWMLIGLAMELDVASAELIPRLKRPDAPMEEGYSGVIRFFLPVVKFLTDRGLAGVAAHEFAHAVRAARLGKGWFKMMKENERAEERYADRIAAGWGFGREIRTMRKEFKCRVYPGIDRIRKRAVRSALASLE